MVLRSTRLEHFFDAVVDGSMIKRSKPDPERYLLAAELLECTRENCFVFEDTYPGIFGAQQAGFFTVALGEGAKKARPDVWIENFSSITPSELLILYLQK